MCNGPGVLFNPCGTGIDYKIVKAGDDEMLSAMMTTTTMASTTSLISAMTMLWFLLW
jgi:hypothetical protein